MADSPGLIDSHISLLDERRQRAVRGALATSAAEGIEVSAVSVRLLVDYARGEITAQQYAQGMVEELCGSVALPPQSSEQAVEDEQVQSEQPSTSQPVHPTAGDEVSTSDDTVSDDLVTKDTMVDAFVNGRISVEDFLRIARS